MDFFARQENARAQTRLLIVLFVIGVIALVTAVTVALVVALVAGASRTAEGGGLEWLLANGQVVGAIAVGVLAIVLFGSAGKWLSLQGGGAVVARAMGADLVDASTRDPQKRRLLNVVEEMAIASGTPVPAVYVMDREAGINAFAAGHTPADSAVAVTRGALERFDRDELQGVIGHEFSHILNGDMRLNMRLLAMVAGLFAIAHVGRVLARSRSRRSKDGGGLVLAGLLMLVLGYVGVLFGRLIQAAISRQREFLADASAVQFTRDPGGLRDALVKVGASDTGSRLDSAETEEVAHMLFASGFAGLFATHPPLAERIRAIDPSFQPEEFERVRKELRAAPPVRVPADAAPVPRGPGQWAVDAEAAAPLAEAFAEHAATESLAGHAAAEAHAGRFAVDPAAVPARVANPRPRHVRYARLLHAAAPAELVDDAADPERATTLLWALVLGAEPTGRARERQVLADAYGAQAAAAAEQKLATVAALAPEQRLPLLLRLLPALARQPAADHQRLLDTIARMVGADGTITVSEYALARLARVHLAEQAAPPRGGGRDKLLSREPDLQMLFSVLARHGHANEADARDAFERGMTRALPGRRPPYLTPDPWVSALDQALDRLDRLDPEGKARLVESLAVVIGHDGTLSVAEAELLRAICGSLHCPLPPFVEDADPGPYAR
jgi:Zn-dependent protease with chaperone function